MESRRAWERGGDSQGCWAWGELGSSGDGDAGASLLVADARAAGQAFLWAAQGARPAILAAPQGVPARVLTPYMKQASPRRYR